MAKTLIPQNYSFIVSLE